MLWVYLLTAGFMVQAQETEWFHDLNRRYHEGVELFDQQHFVSARKVFDELLQETRRATDPDIVSIRTNAQYYQAISAMELLNPDGEKLLTDFLRQNPSHSKSNLARFYLGRHYYFKKKYSRSIEQFEQVDIFDLDPAQMLDYKFMLGYDYFFKKDFRKSKRLFADVKDSEKYFYPAHYYYGYILYQEGKYDAALENLKKAGESNYFGQVVPFYIASIYYQQGKVDHLLDYAVPKIRETNRLKYFTEINQLVGKAYFEKGEYEEALPYLEYYAGHVRKMEKEDIYQLAYCQYKTGNYEKAIDNFKELNQQNDSLGQNAMYLLGLCYLETGNKAKARLPLMEASQEDYDLFIKEHALFNYAKLSYEMGYGDVAIRSVNAFLSEFPSSQYRTEASELLTDILISSHNYKDAIETIESLPDKTPKIKEAYQLVAYYRGVELYNDKNYAEARKMFLKSVQYPLDPAIEAQCYYWIAEMELSKGNYQQAIRSYNKFLGLAGNNTLPPESSKATAYYGLGYVYMKTEKYASALSNFARSRSAFGRFPGQAAYRNVRQKVVPDLILRTADCQFILNKRQDALDSYNEVIRNNYPGTDYAYFQKGMLLGLMNKPEGKIQAMEQITSKYPNSIYYDDALYQKANTYLIQNQYTRAIAGFEELMDKQKNSLYVVQSLLKLGLIYYNMNNNAKSVAYYQQVATDYPNTPEAEEALDRIKEIAIETGRTDWYDNTPGASLSEQDTVLFKAAEKYYFEGDCGKAKKELGKYLNRFPDGYFALTAHYYRADCLDREKAYADALKDYEYVINYPRITSYSEVSFLRAAKIRHYLLKDYDKAFLYYRKLLSIASLKENRQDALSGLMFTGWETGRLNDVVRYAKQVLADAQSTPENVVDAHYYLGKVAYQNGDYEKAIIEFTQTAQQTSSEKAAEAKYLTALMYFRQGNLDMASANCDEVLKNYSGYEYWLVKTYILIADIAVENEELYQAKATLESIVNNYNGNQTLLNEAKEKLDIVKRKLGEKSRIKSDSDSLSFPDNE